MARMGHEGERAAMIYQHEARGADQVITSAIDTHVEGVKRRDGTSHAFTLRHFAFPVPDPCAG